MNAVSRTGRLGVGKLYKTNRPKPKSLKNCSELNIRMQKGLSGHSNPQNGCCLALDNQLLPLKNL
jgi:hypothetical protein